MDSQKRLERLNAYLISKGKKPKSTVPVNFVKQNIAGVKLRYGDTNCLGIEKSKISKSGDIEKTVGLPKKLALSASNRRSRLTVKNEKKGTLCQSSTSAKLDAKSPHMKKKSYVDSPLRKKVPSKDKENSARIRKKLVRRSINMLARNQSVRSRKRKSINSATPNRSCHTKKSVASVPRLLNTTLKKNLLTKSNCKSTGSTPVTSHKRALPQPITNAEKSFVNCKQLNNWLSSKGKKPLGFDHGFKAAKVLRTPVGSPMPVPESSPCLTPSSQSHWQGLRDEDDLDEIAALVRNVMSDINKCIDEGCPVSILESTIYELSDKVPKVKKQASYWITLAKIQQAAGAGCVQICDVYEKAMLAKAQPLNDIQEALNETLLNRVKEKEEYDNHVTTNSVSTHQTVLPHPALHNIIVNSPMYKNAATSPIVFDSPTTTDQVPSLVIPGSPSSVVKLRLLSKSSPVFKRLKSLRTLPESASAIITPVRRSTRIADAQKSYPKGLRDHEPCLSSVQEIFPALGYDSTDFKSDGVSCDVVFDPNSALVGGTDIAKVLKF